MSQTKLSLKLSGKVLSTLIPSYFPRVENLSLVLFSSTNGMHVMVNLDINKIVAISIMKPPSCIYA